MLLKYKRDYQKIAMGFLSFEPDLKVLSNLQSELKLFAEDAGHQLYLYKDADNDFSGVVGIEDGDGYVLVRHLQLAPALRNQETINTVLDELASIVGARRIMGSLETTPLIMRWEEHRREP